MKSPIEKCLSYTLEAGASELIIVEGFTPAVRLFDEVRLIEDAPIIYFGTLDAFLKKLDAESGVFTAGPWDDVYWRVRYSRGAFGKQASFRPILSKCPSFEELGAPQALTSLLEVSSGLILFAGTPCSGKTTSASSYVSALCKNRVLRAIFLDPVGEMEIPTGDTLLMQAKSEDISKTLKQGLLAGTDLFWLGDLKQENIIDALRAAGAGAIVVATFTAGNSMGVLDALVSFESVSDMQMARSLLSTNLKAIVMQHLIPAIDFSQMFAAWELIYNTQNISSLIRSGEHFKLPSLIASASAEGMLSIDMSLKELVESQCITKENALKLAFDPSKIP
jgi:twitching motility protein PilT